MSKKQKRKFNFDDIEDNKEFKLDNVVAETTTNVLNIDKKLRLNTPQKTRGENHLRQDSEVKSTSVRDNSVEVKNTSDQTEVKSTEVKFTSEVKNTSGNYGAEVINTSQYVEPAEYIFKDIVWYVFSLPITNKEKVLLVTLLSFKQTLLSFSNTALAEFMGDDRGNIGKIINRLTEKGYINKFSKPKVKRNVDISPVIQGYLNFKEVYNVSPEDVLSICGEVKITSEIPVMLGYIYNNTKEETEQTKQEKVKQIKLSSKERVLWREIISIFSLMNFSMEKISMDTFKFIKDVPDSKKDDLNRALAYVAFYKNPKNPYKLLVAAFQKEYYTQMEESQYEIFKSIQKLFEYKDRTSLLEFLLQGGKSVLSHYSESLRVGFNGMIETANIIQQKVFLAKSEYEKFEKRFNIKHMDWKEELNEAQKRSKFN